MDEIPHERVEATGSFNSPITQSNIPQRFTEIDDIKFITRPCNKLTNTVAQSLYPLSQVPGNKLYLSTIEVLKDYIKPLQNKEYQSVHLIRQRGVFDAVKTLLWDKHRKFKHNYIAAYVDSDAGTATDICSAHIRVSPHNWIKVEDIEPTTIIDAVRMRTFKKIQLFTAEANNACELNTILLTAAALPYAANAVAAISTHYFTSKSITALYIFARMFKKLHLILPEAGDDIWIVGVGYSNARPAANVDDLSALTFDDDKFVKFVYEFLTNVNAVREAKNKFIKHVVSKYADKTGPKFIPDMIMDDIQFNYRDAIAEISHAWRAKYGV